jgi:hypothetical protein
VQEKAASTGELLSPSFCQGERDDISILFSQPSHHFSIKQVIQMKY